MSRSAHGRLRHVVGLIGTDILGSLSPALHEQEAALLGLRYVYLTFDLHEMRRGAEAVGELVEAAGRLHFAGLNVTHPCKQLVIDYLDALSPEAEVMKAVNTVVFRDGRAIGHNTDWCGFGESLRQFLPDVPRDDVIVLGAGGAGSAATYALLVGGAGRVTVIDLERKRAEALAGTLVDRSFEGRVEAAGADELAARLAAADGLVQATPVGMAPRGGVPFEPSLLRSSQWVFDIVYRPAETELLRRARGLGCRTLNGGPMVVYQAAEALRLFTGVEPRTERMMAHLAALEGAEG